MPRKKSIKTIQEINRRIQEGKAVVVTADEMSDIVKRMGPKKAAKEVDVVTTGTFAPMCSSGALINFGHSKPQAERAASSSRPRAASSPWSRSAVASVLASFLAD